MLRLNIHSYGSFARHALSAQPIARVQGSISKGIFLIFPDRKVVFISYQPFAGPLNLTLQEPLPAAPLPVQIGDDARVSEVEIFFPTSEITLDLRPARPWTAPLPPESARNVRESLDRLARRAFAARPEDGWAALLPHLLSWDFLPTLPDHLKVPLACLLDARDALHRKDTAAALPHLTAITGLGRGLTPSGDDCLSGLLLMRRRAGLEAKGQDALAAPLIQAAYERTTAISANILEASAAGESEQRLLTACDAVLSGQVDDPRVMEGLLDYGSSSGLDALVGMAVAATT